MFDINVTFVYFFTKKTVTLKKDKKDVDKETPIKGTPKVSKSEEVDEVPPSLEKKEIWLP